MTKKAVSLLELLKASIEEPAVQQEQEHSTDEGPSRDIVCSTHRFPAAVLSAVSALARENDMSVSLVINILLDDYLLADGHPGYAALAPWYPDYALKKGQTK